MLLNAQLQNFNIGNDRLQAYVPDAAVTAKHYALKKADGYWSRPWPAAIALCHFLQQHTAYIQHMNLLELAAGLGLPGLYAARYAKTVALTDISADAVGCMQQTVQALQLNNVQCHGLDWKQAAQQPPVDVVLLSDVNYDPLQFSVLQQLITHYLQQHTTIIISTPQRLLAKPFISQLIPWCTQQWNTEIDLHNTTTGVSVYVLQQQ